MQLVYVYNIIWFILHLLLFISVSLPESSLALIPDPDIKWGFDTSEFTGNNQWKLTDVHSVLGTRFSSSNIKFYLNIARKPSYFLVNVAAPIIALSVLHPIL